MRLFEFIPIYDVVVAGESLIEQAFGPEFCVIDEAGQLLTTSHNQKLLWQAQALIGDANAAMSADARMQLRELRAQAEIVVQADYEAALRRELHPIETDDLQDYSLRAGGLL